MLIIVAGQILNFTVVQAGIGREMAQYLATHSMSPFVFFTALFVLYLVLGTFLDGISMMMLTVPVLYPTLKAMGFSEVWFGVILVIQAELAQLSPPIGLNLFAVQSIARDVSPSISRSRPAMPSNYPMRSPTTSPASSTRSATPRTRRWRSTWSAKTC
jgi:TRAP-type C4-dicarboxylate transport system permease large subunit